MSSIGLPTFGPFLGCCLRIDKSFFLHAPAVKFDLYHQSLVIAISFQIVDFQEKINFYVMNCVSFLKSSRMDIRANAATLVGFLLGNLSASMRDNVSKEHVCSGKSSFLNKTLLPLQRQKKQKYLISFLSNFFCLYSLQKMYKNLRLLFIYTESVTFQFILFCNAGKVYFLYLLKENQVFSCHSAQSYI